MNHPKVLHTNGPVSETHSFFFLFQCTHDSRVFHKCRTHGEAAGTLKLNILTPQLSFLHNQSPPSNNLFFYNTRSELFYPHPSPFHQLCRYTYAFSISHTWELPSSPIFGFGTAPLFLCGFKLQVDVHIYGTIRGIL